MLFWQFEKMTEDVKSINLILVVNVTAISSASKPCYFFLIPDNQAEVKGRCAVFQPFRYCLVFGLINEIHLKE